MKKDFNVIIKDSVIKLEDNFWNDFNKQTADFPDNDDGFRLEIIIAEAAICSMALSYLSRFTGENRELMTTNLIDNILHWEQFIDP